MIRFIFRRILETIPVLWAVATITFFMLRLAPGGPFDDERQVSPEVLRTLQAHYGLDKPLMAQYGDYLLNLLKGDLGPSFKYPGRTVNEIIRDSFPNSMELGFYSMSIALALGLTLGILASLKPNSLLDYLPSSMAMVGICLPTFVLGPLGAGVRSQAPVVPLPRMGYPSDQSAPFAHTGCLLCGLHRPTHPRWHA